MTLWMTWEQQIFQWLMSFVCFVSTWLVSCPTDNKEILHSNVLPPGRLHSRAFSLHNQQWWAPSDRTWKINYLEYLNIWNIKFLKYWTIGEKKYRKERWNIQLQTVSNHFNEYCSSKNLIIHIGMGYVENKD